MTTKVHKRKGYVDPETGPKFPRVKVTDRWLGYIQVFEDDRPGWRTYVYVVGRGHPMKFFHYIERVKVKIT